MLSLQDAAAELSWTEDQLFMRMLDDGVILPHPSGVGYLRYPNSVMGASEDQAVILQEDQLYSAWIDRGSSALTFVHSALVRDTDDDLAPVWAEVEGRTLVSDTTVETAGFLFRQARIRIWR